MHPIGIEQGSRATVVCAPMTSATRAGAARLLGAFLGDDAHYRASAAAYGDGGAGALARALDLFLARPELGFVWLAAAGDEIVGACVICYAISTSRGGVGTAMLDALRAELRRLGVGRIDTACHRANEGAWRFYARHGFQPLDEERIALLL